MLLWKQQSKRVGKVMVRVWVGARVNYLQDYIRYTVIALWLSYICV